MEQTGLCLILWQKEGEEENEQKCVLEKGDCFQSNTTGVYSFRDGTGSSPEV